MVTRSIYEISNYVDIGSSISESNSSSRRRKPLITPFNCMALWSRRPCRYNVISAYKHAHREVTSIAGDGKFFSLSFLNSIWVYQLSSSYFANYAEPYCLCQVSSCPLPVQYRSRLDPCYKSSTSCLVYPI